MQSKKGSGQKMIRYRDKSRKVHEIEGDLFVCKDKNSKDVFAGDKVKSGKRVLTIVWDKDCLQWRAGEEDNPYFAPLSQWAISEQFELIEDKKDEGENASNTT